MQQGYDQAFQLQQTNKKLKKWLKQLLNSSSAPSKTLDHLLSFESIRMTRLQATRANVFFCAMGAVLIKHRKFFSIFGRLTSLLI